MDVSVRDAARLLEVSEKTVYRWIKKGVLPAYRLHDQYRLNRVELAEWAATHRRPLRAPAAAEDKGDEPPPSAAAAIRRGGISYRVGGRTREEVLRAVVELPGIPREVNRATLLEVLRAREQLASTAIGGGIAIPHPRTPLVVGVDDPTVLLCFLEHEVDFGALDGTRVHTLFLLLSPTVQAHLQLLARLGFVLQDAAFTRLLQRRASQEALLSRLDALRVSTERPARRGSA